jgi:hypothetical protein
MGAGESDNRHFYELVVRGELDQRFSFLFGDLQMTHNPGETILKGPVLDQAELHGFIERVEELGLEILLVRQADG